MKQGVFFRDYAPLPSVLLIDAEYKITGPAHMGYAQGASVTVSGPHADVIFSGCDWSKDDAYQTTFTFGRISSYADGALFDRRMVDFDFRTADPPIMAGQQMALLLIGKHDYWIRCSGIVLRSIEGGVYERIGSMDFGFSRHDQPEEDHLKEFINALPVKQFKIV